MTMKHALVSWLPLRRHRAVHPWRLLATCWLAVQLLASCGELFDVDDDGPAAVTATMRIDRDSVFLLPGDSLRLFVSFVPERPANTGVMWLADDAAVARMVADTLVACQPGETVVMALSVDGLRPDSCVVSVMDPWAVRPADFFFDTVIYADIRVGGRCIDDSLLVGAFVDDELRGVAELRETAGRQYAVIRVYGPVTASVSDTITFHCFDRRQARLRRFDVTVPFDGKSHGSLSHPLALMLD